MTAVPSRRLAVSYKNIIDALSEPNASVPVHLLVLYLVLRLLQGTSLLLLLPSLLLRRHGVDTAVRLRVDSVQAAVSGPSA